MQPNQPYSPPPPEQTPEQNPYDFIMNTGADQKKPGVFNLPSGNSTKQRMLIFGGGLFALIIIGVLLLSLLGGSGKSNSETLLSLAQTQTELIRVADLASKEPTVRNEATRVLAANTSLSVTSTKNQVVSMITKSGKKVGAKQLALSLNTKTDSELKTATENNQYDEVVVGILTSGLKSYRNQLKTTYDSVSNQKDKQVLSEAYKGVGILLQDTKTPN